MFLKKVKKMKTRSNHIFKLLGTAVMAVLMLSACKKQTVISPTFDVTTDKTTYNINEPITFNFTGTADVVQFFSGAPGAEYKFKNRTTVVGKPQIEFTTFREVPASMQAGTLSLLVSKDFANLLNTEDIQKATWVDLSSRVTFSTGANNTPSGTIDLSDQFEPNAPLNIAFRYTAAKDAAAAQPKWTVRNVVISNVLADSTVVPIITQANMGWGAFSILGAQTWNLGTITAPVFTGGAINADANEDWLISLPVQLDRAQRVYGTSIKVSATTKLEKYTFAGYGSPGTYTVAFEVFNANKWETKTVVKELTITVK
jgi:hypothetical protein